MRARPAALATAASTRRTCRTASFASAAWLLALRRQTMRWAAIGDERIITFLAELSYSYESSVRLGLPDLMRLFARSSIEVGKMEQYVVSPVILQRAHLGSKTQF